MTPYHVDRDFDSMPYAFANDNRSSISKLVQGYREMWAAVLEEAFRSADLGEYMRSTDFERVCEFAGVEADVSTDRCHLQRADLTSKPYFASWSSRRNLGAES